MRLGYLKIREVADYLGVSERTVRNYISLGVMPTSPLTNVKLRATKFGRSWRVRESDLAAFEAAVETMLRNDG